MPNELKLKEIYEAYINHMKVEKTFDTHIRIHLSHAHTHN